MGELFGWLGARSESLGLLGRFWELDDLGAIHLPHCVNDLGRILFAGIAAEEVGKQNQRANEGENSDGEKHNVQPSRGTPRSISQNGVLWQWVELLTT